MAICDELVIKPDSNIRREVLLPAVWTVGELGAALICIPNSNEEPSQVFISALQY